MGVVITLEDIQAYAEVDYIIHHMNERYIEKVPTKLLDFFKSVKDPTYDVYVNPHIPLQDQGLKRYTLEILAILHVKYWCENEQRKAELLAMMQENQDKLETQIREKFSVDKLFDNPSAKVINNLDDLKNQEDFTKPRTVTKYVIKNNTEENQNTDVAENIENLSQTSNSENALNVENINTISKEETATATLENNQEIVENTQNINSNNYPQEVEKEGIFTRIKNFFFRNKIKSKEFKNKI
jgi:hypothetical protein